MKGETMEQTYPSQWESLALHNIVRKVWEAKNIHGQDAEQFWLQKLEAFLLSI